MNEWKVPGLNEFKNPKIELSPTNKFFILNSPCLIFNRNESYPNYLLNGLDKVNISMTSMSWNDEENLICGGLEDFSIGIFNFKE